MCDTNSSEMVNGCTVKEESEMSVIEGCNMGREEKRSEDTFLKEDITIKEECAYQEEDPLLTFQCKFCRIMYTSRCDLVAHLQAKHMQEKCQNCQNCSEMFHKKSELVLHNKENGQAKPHNDKVCKRNFLSRFSSMLD